MMQDPHVIAERLVLKAAQWTDVHGVVSHKYAALDWQHLVDQITAALMRERRRADILARMVIKAK